jgi:hypothetical protein
VTTPANDEKAFRRRVRQARIGRRLARSASRKRRGWIDRLLTRLLRRAIAPASPADDYMRDEIVDADIGFSAEELERYQRSAPER